MDSFILAVCVTCLASILQGITGFGAGLISMGVLSSIWSVPQATAVMIPLAVSLNLSLILQNYLEINLSLIKWILAGIPLGVIIGVSSLELLPETTLKTLLGLALLASVVNALVRDHTPRDHPPRDHPALPSLLAGVSAGVLGSALSAAGPPLLIYANLQGWKRDLFRAQLSVLFMTSSLLALIGLSVRGLIHLESLSISIRLTPGVLLGSWLGVKLGTYLPQHIFQRLVLGLLMLLSAQFLTASIYYHTSFRGAVIIRPSR